MLGKVSGPLERRYVEGVHEVCRVERSRSVLHVMSSANMFLSGISLAELWHIFRELDLDGNGHLDSQELNHALDKAGKSLFLSCVSGLTST